MTRTKPTCSIDGCERPHNCRGWCRMHYKRWLAHGDPLCVKKGKPPALDRTGVRYGSLVALALAGRDAHGPRWLCRCDCGREKVIRGSHLGRTLSCGCLADPSIDRVGVRYGRLIAIERVANGASWKARWLCRCDCGSETIVTAGNLKTGAVRSCGCLRREMTNKPEGVAARNSVISTYRHSARTRGHVWSLTDDEFDTITSAPCAYCGLAPSNQQNSSPNGSFTYSGIDRIDNSQGYVSGNVVPCCHPCNQAKAARPLAEFEAWLDRIARFRRGQK